MANLSATDARRGFFEIVKGAAERHEVYRIQHRKGSVVLLSESDYDSLIETLELLSLPGFRERLQASAEQAAAGDTLALNEAFGPE